MVSNDVRLCGCYVDLGATILPIDRNRGKFWPDRGEHPLGSQWRSRWASPQRPPPRIWVAVSSTARPVRRDKSSNARPACRSRPKRRPTFHVLDQSGKGKPDGARVNAGAALVDVPAHYKGGFQILTPRAVAAVRGTSWIVDVKPSQTSVFVIRGRVAVHRVGAGRTVPLRQGDGVDVDDTSAALSVKRWRPDRAAALLARFGR